MQLGAGPFLFLFLSCTSDDDDNDDVKEPIFLLLFCTMPARPFGVCRGGWVAGAPLCWVIPPDVFPNDGGRVGLEGYDFPSPRNVRQLSKTSKVRNTLLFGGRGVCLCCRCVREACSE